MNPFHSLEAVVLGACVVFFFRAGLAEDGPAWGWAAASLLISVLAWGWLGWGPLGMFAAQAALFTGIGVVRMLRKPRKP